MSHCLQIPSLESFLVSTILSDLSDAALFVLPKIFKLRTMFRARHTSGTSPVATFLYDQSRFSSKELEHDKTPFNQPNCGRYMQISRPKRLSSLSCCRHTIQELKLYGQHHILIPKLHKTLRELFDQQKASALDVDRNGRTILQVCKFIVIRSA